MTKITAGGGHSLFLKSDGSLWAMGFNFYGQLGDGALDQFNPTARPEQIAISNVTAVAAGYFYSLFIRSDGSLWGMGRNDYGELGIGNYGGADPRLGTNRPVLIVSSNVTAIAGGGGDGVAFPIPGAQTLFLKNDGSLWAMGFNGLGQLGDGTGNDTNRPEQIVASNVTTIAAGWLHSLFIKNDGSLWVMGGNQYGQLGDGTTNLYSAYPEPILTSNVIAIAAGGTHSLFLKSDGSLWAMGDSGQGQLGAGTYNRTNNQPIQIVASNVVAIAAGGTHSLFLMSDGSLWAMGGNQYGQLGDGTFSRTNRPERIVASGVTAIAAGGQHSLFLKVDGSLWAMGNNSNGQLGNGNHFSASTPVSILAPYNQISGQRLNGTNLLLSFVGVANGNYALDRSANLSPPDWIPQATNPASSYGAMVFTNSPDITTNNFWRIRSVP